MDASKFTEEATGRLKEITTRSGTDVAFVPNPLPPEVELGSELLNQLIRAREALARLDEAGKLSHASPELLLKPLQSREAQRSSRMEGTYAEPEQLAIFRADPDADQGRTARRDDYQEVANYAKALETGFSSDLPFSKRLVKKLHAILLDGVRGEKKDPGNFRTLQVAVSENREEEPRYIPPPGTGVERCMNELEEYVHGGRSYDPLIEAFLVHYQFEAIHPFYDGNGRVGRVLLALTIAQWCGLANQWLYLSSYFDEHKSEYIDLLFRISSHGEWERWLSFCLEGVISQSNDTRERFDRLADLSVDFRNRLQSLPRPSSRLIEITELLFEEPAIHATRIAERFDVSSVTAHKDIDRLEELDILHEVPDYKGRYGRTIYIAPEVLAVAFDEERINYLESSTS